MSSLAPEMAIDAATVWRPDYPVDVRRTLSVLGHGRGDPCHRVVEGVTWQTSRMPTGSVTYRIWQDGPYEISAQAWGDGADELIDSVPRLLGRDDSPEDFDPRHPLLREARRRLVGLRIPATGRVIESLIPAILEQKVVGLDAAAAWRRLVTRFGEPAPGPAPSGMRLAPTPATWTDLPSWDWHLAGIEEKRARTARTGASYARRLETLAATRSDEPKALYRALTALPGVGRWTAAEVGHRVLGDADAVPIGDYHLGSIIGWGLRGEKLGDDEVEEFLEPWRPHRYRVFRLLELTPAAHPPRHGPRMSRQDYRRI